METAQKCTVSVVFLITRQATLVVKQYLSNGLASTIDSRLVASTSIHQLVIELRLKDPPWFI